MLLRNPADYKGGFWVSCRIDGEVHVTTSTEPEAFAVAKKENLSGLLKLSLDRSEPDLTEPYLRFDIDLWSYNKPTLLIRHKTTNVGDLVVEDLKVYHMMDFDIGGPMSYKDDVGLFDVETGLMRVFDTSSIGVALSSRPAPQGWEIAPPTQLRIDPDCRDLRNNREFGPMDIATALQWNLGDLKPDEAKTVDLAIVATASLDELDTLMKEAWKLFKRKVR
ncbi:MAG: hypothetical protein ACFFAY_14815 [Promethearchaeota archaeon]